MLRLALELTMLGKEFLISVGNDRIWLITPGKDDVIVLENSLSTIARLLNEWLAVERKNCSDNVSMNLKRPVK
jgi:hypothetical protein